MSQISGTSKAEHPCLTSQGYLHQRTTGVSPSPMPTHGPLNLPTHSSSLTHTPCSTLVWPTALASTLKAGHALNFLVAIVQNAGSSMITTASTYFTTIEQVPCAHPYSPCCCFTVLNRSACFFKIKSICLRHCVRWADLFHKDLQGIDKTDVKGKGSYPRLMAPTWDAASSALYVSFFMLRRAVGSRNYLPQKTILCCASKMMLNGGNNTGSIKPASRLPASAVPLLEIQSEINKLFVTTLESSTASSSQQLLMSSRLGITNMAWLW